MSQLRNEAYPLGMFGIVFLNTLFTQWIVFFFAPPGTVRGPGGAAEAVGSLSGVGALLFVGYLLMALVNPWIGGWSDRLRTRWGRRRPLIALATPALAAMFALIWTRALPAWVAIPLYCVLFVVVVQPYAALLPSVASEERVRLRMSLVGAVLALVSVGLALIAGPFLVKRLGFAGLGWAGATALLVTVLGPTLLLVETPPSEEPAAGGPKVLLELLRQQGVTRFLAGNALLTGGFTALLMAAPYVTVALLAREQTWTARLNGVLFLGMLVSIPLVGALAKRLQPLGELRGSALLAGAVLLALGGWAGASGAAAREELGAWYVSFAILGLPSLVVLALPPVVLSAFGDRDGRDRQGAFFGLNGAAINLGNAGAAVSTATLLGLGSSVEDPRGVVGVLIATGAAFALGGALFPPPRVLATEERADSEEAK
ncbi:MAG TPA: hypothetical protein DEA08_25690 [Planctomycetes bacterium]|mgnify:CR=1 FL=1|nr:hypothetical protein [Planctomycetota bacterium]